MCSRCIQIVLVHELTTLYRDDMATMSSRSAPVAHPEGFAVTFYHNDAKQGWWELASSISSCTASSGHQARDTMVQLLSKAESIAKADDSWSSSGVVQQLQRALALAQKGQLLGAQRTALNAVDFATTYRRISEHKTSSSTERKPSGMQSSEGAREAGSHQASIARHQALGGGASSSSTASDVTSSGITPAAPSAGPHVASAAAPAPAPTLPLLQQQQQDLTSSFSFQVLHRPTDANTAEVPHKRQKLLPGPNSMEPAMDDAFAAPTPRLPVQQPSDASQERMQSWCGQLALMSGEGRACELCTATLQLPSTAAHNMPTTLKFTHLVQRRGVTLGHYQAVRASINKASARQLSRLRSMAQHELVAVQALSQNSHIILVPYTDKKSQLKLVCFYLQT